MLLLLLLPLLLLLLLLLHYCYYYCCYYYCYYYYCYCCNYTSFKISAIPSGKQQELTTLYNIAIQTIERNNH